MSIQFVKEEVALVSVPIHIHTNTVDTIGLLPYPCSMAVVGLMDLVRARRLLLLYLLFMFDPTFPQHPEGLCPFPLGPLVMLDPDPYTISKDERVSRKPA